MIYHMVREFLDSFKRIKILQKKHANLGIIWDSDVSIAYFFIKPLLREIDSLLRNRNGLGILALRSWQSSLCQVMITCSRLCQSTWMSCKRGRELCA